MLRIFPRAEGATFVSPARRAGNAETEVSLASVQCSRREHDVNQIVHCGGLTPETRLLHSFWIRGASLSVLNAATRHWLPIGLQCTRNLLHFHTIERRTSYGARDMPGCHNLSENTTASRTAARNVCLATTILMFLCLVSPCLAAPVEGSSLTYRSGGRTFALRAIEGEFVAELAPAPAKAYRSAPTPDAVVPRVTSVAGSAYELQHMYGNRFWLVANDSPQRSSAAGTGGRVAATVTSAVEKAAALRNDTAIVYAYPVYHRSGSNLRIFPRPEIVVRVAPGVDVADMAARYKLHVVRGLIYTRDQFVLGCEPAADPYALCAELDQNDDIAWAAPNHEEQRTSSAYTPTDPLFDEQWHLHNVRQSGGIEDADIDAVEAWERFRIADGTQEVVIAIVDSFVDMDHPDLPIWQNPAERDGFPYVDDDGNGYWDDINGWDFFEGDNDPDEDGWSSAAHGTAVAGVAAAIEGNDRGVVGVACGASILPVALGDGNFWWCSEASTADALRYAARHADVVNASWGSQTLSPVISNALDFAAGSTAKRGALGVPVLFASGNEADETPSYGTKFDLTAGQHEFRFVFESFGGGAAEGPVQITYAELFDWDSGTSADLDTFSDTVDDVTYGGDVPFRRVGDFFRYSYESGLIGAGQTSTMTWTFGLAVAAEYDVHVRFTGNTGPCGRLRLFIDDVELVGTSHFIGPIVEMPYTGPGNFTALVGENTHPGVINIGASDIYDRRSSYSQYGERLHFVAPSSRNSRGDYALTTTDVVGSGGYNETVGADGDYDDSFTGTSAACPVAAGVFATCIAYKPDITVSELMSVLQQTADKIGGVAYDPNGFHEEYGYGRLNLNSALAELWRLDASPFERFLADLDGHNGFDFSDPADAGAGVDFDDDDDDNFTEFARGSDPTDINSRVLVKVYLVSDPPPGVDQFVITFLVRSGAAFDGTTALQAVRDGVRYTVDGARDVSVFDTAVQQVDPPVTDGLPPAPAQYEYRSFRLDGGTPLPNRGFVRTTTEEME